MGTVIDHEVRHRMSAVERKEEILEAAVAEFAVKGLHGTSTEAIAKRAGVSQPYLFRLFGTKKGLFIEAVERGFDRIQHMFGEAVAEAGPAWEARMAAMGDRYFALLGEAGGSTYADAVVRGLLRSRGTGGGAPALRRAVQLCRGRTGRR